MALFGARALIRTFGQIIHAEVAEVCETLQKKPVEKTKVIGLGWICPRCGSIWAPHVRSCENPNCDGVVFTPDTNSTE